MTTVTKVQVKLYAQKDQDKPLESYIPLFHRWIQKKALDEMVFDVADYTHVPRGTGVLLVGHASDYSLDEGEGRPGLLYSRKRDLPAGAPLVSDAIRRARAAAGLIDSDPAVTGPRGFSEKELLFRFPERLFVTNDEESFASVRGLVEEALTQQFPGVAFTLSREGEPREPLTIRALA